MSETFCVYKMCARKTIPVSLIVQKLRLQIRYLIINEFKLLHFVVDDTAFIHLLVIFGFSECS